MPGLRPDPILDICVRVTGVWVGRQRILLKGAKDIAGDSLVPLATTGFFDSIQNVS